jgi:hypothetical protein
LLSWDRLSAPRLIRNVLQIWVTTPVALYHPGVARDPPGAALPPVLCGNPGAQGGLCGDQEKRKPQV